ncbi:MAG: DUF58 domain-containing protein [Alphaproteobacteria bacterium]|nr:DUF58 domain-containing protein [Alphaproteobacteria bacterium]
MRINISRFLNPPQEKSGLSLDFGELMDCRRQALQISLKSLKNTSRNIGNIKSAFKGRGIEMEEIREYTFGDDVRDIDWRVSARKRTPYTKVYNEEKDREIYVLLDLSASMLFATRNELKSVTASKAAAMLGWLAQENNDRFAAFIFDGKKTWRFAPQRSQAHLLAIFKKIVETSQSVITENIPSSGLVSSLNIMQKTLHGGASVFIISDFCDFDDNMQKALAILAKKTQVFCLNVCDVLEIEPPRGGEYMIADGKESLVFDTRSKAFCEEYRRYFADKRQVLKDFCKKFDCHVIEIRNDMPLCEQMKII